MILWIILGIVVILTLAVLYVLSTRCRPAGPQIRKFRRFAYAHRGLHDAVRPENSLSAFRAARDAGYGIELDVHLLRDGSLAVIHDHSLLRTTGQEGRVEDLAKEDLWNYRLEGSAEYVPTLDEVLDVMGGETPLIIELKADKNAAQLAEAVCNRLDSYKGMYCIESFDPRCIQWLRKNRPEVLRGQLTRNFFRDKQTKMPWILKFCMTHQIFNFVTRPDFVAYRFQDRKRLSNRLIKKFWATTRVTWTITDPEDYEIARREG